MQEHTYAWRGRTVRWWSRGSGPPVVLAHGTPWSSAVWAQQAEWLAADHTVFAWDMPGYGQSSKGEQHRVDLATQSALFTDLLGHWQLESPEVIAHDLGGAVVLRSHLLDGVDFERITLVDTVVIEPWGSPFYALVQANESVFAQIPESIHEGLVSAYIAGASHRGLTDEQLDALVAPWRGPDGRPAFYRQIAHTSHADTDEIEPLLAQVRCARRVIWGAHDAWLPLDNGRELARRLGVELEVIDDAGHLVPWDAPDELNTLLRQH